LVYSFLLLSWKLSYICITTHLFTTQHIIIIIKKTIVKKNRSTIYNIDIYWILNLMFVSHILQKNQINIYIGRFWKDCIKFWTYIWYMYLIYLTILYLGYQVHLTTFLPSYTRMFHSHLSSLLLIFEPKLGYQFHLTILMQ